MPRTMQIEFSTSVQEHADSLGRELKAEEIVNLFKESYNYNNEIFQHISLVDYNVEKFGAERRILNGQVEINGEVVDIKGTGNGPISSLVDALSNLLNIKLGVSNYSEHSLGSGSSTQAASFINLTYRRDEDNEKAYQWGVGVSEDVGDASVKAIFATLNSVIQKGDISIPKSKKAASGSA